MANSVEYILHSVYSSVRGAEQNRSSVPLTLDHLLQERIDAIRGGKSREVLLVSGARDSSTKKPTKLDQLTAMKTAIDQVVSALNKAGSDPAKLRDLGLDTVGQVLT